MEKSQKVFLLSSHLHKVTFGNESSFENKNETCFANICAFKFREIQRKNMSRVSNIESDNSQNVGLEDYNNISVGIFPYFTTPSKR